MDLDGGPMSVAEIKKELADASAEARRTSICFVAEESTGVEVSLWWLRRLSETAIAAIEERDRYLTALNQILRATEDASDPLLRAFRNTATKAVYGLKEA